MNSKTNCSFLFAIFMIACLLAGCVEETEENISSKDPDPSYVMDVTFTYEDGTSHNREVPVNQIIVTFEEDVTPSEEKALLSIMIMDQRALGLSVVGQIPALGIYQLEIENNNIDPEMAIDVLDTVIEALRGYDKVDMVSYNELLELNIVENNDDNSSFRGNNRCAFASIDYYQAIPIFDEVVSDAILNPVTVAVIDSGLWVGSGQFDEIGPRIYNLDSPGVDPSDYHPEKHGTKVASIIASDNGDGIINGIALRVLGDNLSLMVAKASLFGNQIHLHWALAGARQAVEEGARIVNLSFGRHDEGRTPPWLVEMQNSFMRLFKEAPDVLFVASASNHNFILNNNDVPAGLPNSNLITVGGLNSCNFENPASFSSTGPGIDIAAPATNIPVCCQGNDLSGPTGEAIESGNSFAAPIVASIAAIVLSIDPTLTGAQLKEFLIEEEHTWPAPDDVGGKRPALIKTVGSALLNNATLSQAVNTIMDVYGGIADNIPDPSGHIINRLCGEIEFSVDGPDYSQHHSLEATDLLFNTSVTNLGMIGNHQTLFNLFQGGDTVQGYTASGFRINQEYPIYSNGPNVITVSAGAPGGDYTGGGGLSGSIMYTECELTTRSLPLDWFSPTNPGPDQLVFIEVTGTLSPSTVNGFVESGGEIQEDVVYSASGNFTIAFKLIYPDSATLEHLEEVCEGGIPGFQR